jgi:hypothetical protein
MGGDARKTVFLAAMIGLCEVVLLHSALAAQPLEQVTAAFSRASRENHISTPVQAPRGRLDLRPPSATPGTAAVAESFSAPGSHRLFDSQPPSRSDARSSSPPAAQSGHIMSPMETLAHNFHQEGLPVAKLFESNQSLVHLGLNPKGKPGLWIVHKLH